MSLTPKPTFAEATKMVDVDGIQMAKEIDH